MKVYSEFWYFLLLSPNHPSDLMLCTHIQFGFIVTTTPPLEWIEHTGISAISLTYLSYTPHSFPTLPSRTTHLPNTPYFPHTHLSLPTHHTLPSHIYIFPSLTHLPPNARTFTLFTLATHSKGKEGPTNDSGGLMFWSVRRPRLLPMSSWWVSYQEFFFSITYLFMYIHF